MPNRKASSPRKSLPESTAWLFPEYEFGKINPRAYRHVIIERILERGTWAEINWMFDEYGEQAVRDWVRQWGFRALTRHSFALWQLVLGIKRYRAPAWARAAKMDPW
jgi:Family of unknown function (DUF6922)